MSRTHWKHVERDAAALFGARRFATNSGHRVDFAGGGFVGQVKNVARLSLAQLEAFAVEAADHGQAHGSAGVRDQAERRPGQPTPLLVILTEDAWRALQQQTAPPVRLAG